MFADISTILQGRTSFGLWTFLREAERRPSPDGNSLRQIECRCVCGSLRKVRLANLLNGRSKSCGCRSRTLIGGVLKHGHNRSNNKRSREYRSWSSMKYRVLNPKCHAYADYGGRGIVICDRWVASFRDFLTDMGPAPTQQHTIERIDNDGNYEPGNCRWATQKEQQLNRRDLIHIVYEGQRLPLSEAARRAGIPYKLFYRQFRSSAV